MKNLKSKIENSKNESELKSAILSIPKQKNGFRTGLYNLLNDAFWYMDLVTVEQKKQFMLKRI
jgi:hypothetical protein